MTETTHTIDSTEDHGLDLAGLRSASAQARRAARAREVGELFEARPDLAGIYAPADFVAEAVRWSA